jgi:acetyl esterase/lipase
MQWLLLIGGVLAVLHVLNAFLPRRDRWTTIPSFFASWLTNELAYHWFALMVLVAVVGVAGGGLESPAGVVGFVLLVVAGVGLAVIGLEAARTKGQVRQALADLQAVGEAPTNPGGAPKGRFPWSHVAVPVLMRRRRRVRQLRDVTFARVAGRALKLDLTLPADALPGDRRPVALQIHGGAWVLGWKRQQGQPLLNHLATQGWVGVNIDYRLSPAATFPDHLVDCKRALAWVRRQVADFGGDPDFVCVTGGSAGGHLAALMGLTANQVRFQPGFEAVDTTVQAAVPLYGVYDLTNRLGIWAPETYRTLLEPLVVKAFLDEEPERFALASPIDHLHEEAPPFMVVHGDRDILTPVDDARLFVHMLRGVSSEPVLYADLKGAQHGFDLFPSVRAAAVVEGITQFLTTVWRRSQQSALPAASREPEPIETGAMPNVS